MRKLAILTVLVFILSIISVSMVMAQAKPAPAKEPAKAPDQDWSHLRLCRTLLHVLRNSHPWHQDRYG
jgi:hypothetical protein